MTIAIPKRLRSLEFTELTMVGSTISTWIVCCRTSGS